MVFPATNPRRSLAATLRAAWANSEGAGAYLLAIGFMSSVTLVAFFLHPKARLADLAMIHVLAIALIALRFNTRVTMVACVLSILTFDFFFVPPLFRFSWTDAECGSIFVAMLGVSALISSLNHRLRAQERLARDAAFRAEALFQLNADLSHGEDAPGLAAIAARALERLFSAEVTILLRAEDGSLSLEPLPSHEREPADRAHHGARFVISEGEHSSFVWVSLIGLREPLGVVGLSLREHFEEHSKLGVLLMACTSQLATAIERVRLTQAVQQSQLATEAERLRSSLLSAVSHDLKTPLSSIIAAGTTLQERRSQLDDTTAKDLLSTIVDEGERLSRLIQNLLSVTRLESPTVQLRRTPEAIDEIVSAAVARVRPQLGNRRLSVDLEPELGLVLVEPLLIEQVLINLLENACHYGGPDAALAVRVRARDEELAVQVSDSGVGIPEGEHEKIFEKFFRGRSASKADGGVGLGLTICRAIVRAHGGRIVAQNNRSGGALLEFTLPLAPAIAHDDSIGLSA